MKTFKDTRYGDLTGQVYESYINVSMDDLNSLKGAPKEVHGYFNCNYNSNLTSLEGAPKIVEGNFYCTGCPKLTSLDELLDTKIYGKLFSDIITDKEFRENQELYNKAGKNIKKYKLLKKLKGIK